MVRRSPPTPLRLYNGPLPTRGQPKHTLPSLPCPAFCGPAPLSSSTSTNAPGPVPRARMMHTELPQLHIPDLAIPGLFTALDTGSGPSSPTSAASSTGSLSGGGRKRSKEFVRGPWDHSGAIRVPFDVSTVLAPLRPAAINVR